MQNLNISIIQTNLIWENISENLKQLHQKIELTPPSTDLIILPEMFTTGFSMNPEKLAEAPNGQTFQWMQAQAKQKNAVITGSYIVKENKKYFNRLYWVQPDDQFYFYNKKHLFSLSEEPQHYTAGKEKLIIHYKGWKICPLICYDLRFPVWSRNIENYDILIYVANWPEKRSEHWRALLQARAIENQVYTIGVNRVGMDGNGSNHAGNSSIIDYGGNILIHNAHVESSSNITLNYKMQQDFRAQFQFLNDKDVFEIR